MKGMSIKSVLGVLVIGGLLIALFLLIVDQQSVNTPEDYTKQQDRIVDQQVEEEGELWREQSTLKNDSQ